MLSTGETIGIMLAVAFGCMVTRFLPFVFFSRRKTPPFVIYLGKVLPPAMIGFLVIFCFKNTNFSGMAWLPELFAGLVTIALQLTTKKMFLSIALGTAVYMLMIQNYFMTIP